MTSFHHRKTQIYTSFLLLLLTVSFNSSFGHQCQHSHESHNHVHAHHHDHHHHHDDGYADLGVKKLPEELAEEEDLRLENNQFMSRIDHGYDHGVGLWIRAMGCSLLVSLASLICLILLPLIFFQGKPSKVFVDSLAVFGAGAMLGDAFLHQLPHAFVGIVVFLLVEKIVRYVEERSGGTDSLGHGHHHHHRNHKKTDTLQDTSETTSVGSSEPEKQSESVLRKRNISSNSENGTESNIEPVIKKEPEPQSSNLVFGYLNLISDGVHNFTDGMALGSAFLLYGSVGGWSRTLFLLAHELPQEVFFFYYYSLQSIQLVIIHTCS
ncbi:putative zinc/iron permease [Helianthus annuus]|nr:putative zinc/iron permease [Helianthus annuus]KAJ0634071.1 putative zinc/iron permease [Helianthus annuus]